MEKSIVYQLQSEAVDDTSSIIGLLMKAKLVASKLGLDDIIEIINFELNGYPNRDSVPDYRKFRCFPEAFNPYAGWIPIDFGTTPEKYVKEFTTVYVNESISNLEKHAFSSTRLEVKMPHELKQLLYMGCNNNHLYKIAWRFNSYSLNAVLTNVRHQILNWSLELERQGVIGKGINFSLHEKEIAGMVFNNNFHGNINNNGVIGSSTGDVSQENNISIDSFEKLKTELKEIGVTDNEIGELKEAIETSDLPVTDTGFSSKISEWIGNISVKAMQGGLKVTGAVAIATISKLIVEFVQKN